MAKKKISQDTDSDAGKYTVKEVLEYYKLGNDEVVFIHKYRTADFTTYYKVSDLPDKVLKQKVMNVNKGYGGVNFKYNAWQFITM